MSYRPGLSVAVKSLLAYYLAYGAGRNPEVCASEKKHPVHVTWPRENHDA